MEEVQNIQASDWTVYEQRFAIDPDKNVLFMLKLQIREEIQPICLQMDWYLTVLHRLSAA